MGLFGPKGFAAEIVEGIDLESEIMLTGDRITIGNGPNDNLCLGAADIAAAHLTFQKREDGAWEYFTSASGHTALDRGNPRTGKVRAGMWFQIGFETKVLIKKADVPATAKETGDNKIPLSVAIPAMIGMAAVAAFVVFGTGGQEAMPNGLRTTPWFTGSADIEAALERCLENDLPQPAFTTASAIDGPFWSVKAGAVDAKQDLQRIVQNIISETHLLSQENRPLEASETLRRIEYVLPLGTLPCPILSAARFDLALLEMRGTR